MERQGMNAELDDNVVFDISQNPRKRFCAGYMKLSCLRTNTLLWHPASKRWLLPMELALSLGCAVTGSCAQAALMDIDPCLHLYTTSMLGNAMHIPCVGFAITVALACAVPR